MEVIIYGVKVDKNFYLCGMITLDQIKELQQREATLRRCL